MIENLNKNDSNLDQNNSAPLIEFNKRFNTEILSDPYSDEELLVFNRSLMEADKENLPAKVIMVEKACMTNESRITKDSNSNISFSKQANLDFNLNNHEENTATIDMSSNAKLNPIAEKTKTNALVIGEMPIHLNNMFTKCKQSNLTSEMNTNFIDSPTTSARSLFKNQFIPYLILPFSNSIRKLTGHSYISSEFFNKEESQMINKDEPDKKAKIESFLTSGEKELNNPEQILAEKKEPIFQLKDCQENLTYKEKMPYASTPADTIFEQNINPPREQWAHKMEFLLAIIGFSVDLGNIWRFPKIVYENGGGRFLIPYFVQLAFCGLPLFYMELVLGQYHQTGLFTLWEKICPILKGLAFTAIIIDVFMAIFYNTVIAWAVYYLFLSFNIELPWKNCNKDWNTLCCFPLNEHRDMKIIENYTLNNYEYQKKENNNFIYKVYDILSTNNKNNQFKRIVMFNIQKIDTKNNSVTFEAISKFLNNNITLPSKLSYYDSLISSNKSYNAIIESWIKSYFIINMENNLNFLEQIPKIPPIPAAQQAKFIHDTKLLADHIENFIFDHYKNKSVNILLNCAPHLQNPTQEFYTRYLTEMHKSTGLEDIGSIKWTMVFCLMIVFITVYFALWKGIKSAGKAVYITAVAPYIVMFILLIRGLTLEGSSIGISFYLTINNWESLLEMKVWVDAATQIFFSLGPGFGTIIALSSYNKKKNNVYKDALLTSFINCFTSILSGFVVFSTLGHMAFVQGKSIEEVTDAGPGLIFITYPQAISMMPGAPLWAIIFFFMLFTLGIDSTFGGLESVITGICDNFPNSIGKRRSWFVLILIVSCFFLALPTVTYGGPYIVHLFDNFAVAPAILFVVFLEVIGVMYGYGCDRFCDDIYQMIKIKPNKFWILCWKYFSPAIVIVITIMICKGMLSGPLQYGNDYYYVGLGEILAAFIVGIPISFIVIYVMYRFYKTQGTFKERLIILITPSEPWVKSNFCIAEKLENKCLETKQQNGETIRMQSLDNTKYIVVNFNHTTTLPVEQIYSPTQKTGSFDIAATARL